MDGNCFFRDYFHDSSNCSLTNLGEIQYITVDVIIMHFLGTVSQVTDSSVSKCSLNK